MILTISEAARRAGVARSTLYEMKGDISFTKSATGKQGIDLSELSRGGFSSCGVAYADRADTGRQ